MPVTQSVRDSLVERLLEAIDERDFPALMNCYDENVEIVDAVLHEHLHGREAVRPLFEGWFTLIKECKAKPVKITAEGDDVAALFTMRGTMTGALPGLAKELDEAAFDIHVSLFWKVSERGTVIQEFALWDMFNLLRQVESTTR